MLRRWISMNSGWRIAIVAVCAAIVLPVAWYLGSPLFLNVTVDERFPDAAPLSVPTSALAAQPEPTAMLAPTAMPAVTRAPAAVAPTAAPAPSASAATPAPTAPPAEPVALLSGQFTEVDRLHKGSGTATVYRLPDSRIIVRLEPFQVQNGPDLYVYLSGHPMPRSSAQVHDQGAFEIAQLKGNIGNQNYELPRDLDLSQYHSIVIYCKRFAEVFSTAELVMPAE